ncbi:MAG: hydrogenase expression/formation protein HypE [bacterium]|nr:hydrogenase expression/formation protein HypE [bacterium]
MCSLLELWSLSFANERRGGERVNRSKAKFLLGMNMRKGHVEMTHGAGGRVMAQLVEELFVRHFDNDFLNQGNDQAIFEGPGGRMVMSTDGHVVSPLFFPGGDIGSLSVHGTINDVVMSGARPLYLSAGFILEEGFPLADLERIVVSMAAVSKEAGVPIITGDTKVVEKNNGDGVFITSTGIGVVPPGVDISGSKARPGDSILVNGFIGDHGIAILSKRENLEFETQIVSDSAALHDLVAHMVEAVSDLHCLRDPTRGGLATSLNEICWQSGVGMKLREDSIPVRPDVQAASELLGIDPLYVANEGKLIAICPANETDTLLEVMRAHALGQNASVIGEVIEDKNHFVTMETGFGGSRIVDWLAGEQLPRIC